MTISSIRNTVVDFSYQFFEEVTAMLTLTTPESSFYVFQPLHRLLWLGFVACSGFVGFVIYIFERWTPVEDVIKSKFRSVWFSVWYTYPAMVYQGEFVTRLLHVCFLLNL